MWGKKNQRGDIVFAWADFGSEEDYRDCFSQKVPEASPTSSTASANQLQDRSLSGQDKTIKNVIVPREEGDENM